MTLLFLLCSFHYTSAQHPVFIIDINQTGRPLAETNEIGYIPWEIPSATLDTARIVLDAAAGIKITMIRKGPYGTKLSSNWYKAGLSTPYFARLVSDGIRVHDGNAGAQIEMRISGLPAGRHSILTYHNQVDNPATNTFCPFDVYVNGEKKISGLQPSVREVIRSNVPIAYVYADAVAGQDVILHFVADTTSGANIKNLIINGIELNVPNAINQARLPYPVHADRHADADNGTVILRWTAASNAVTSEIYFGKDSAAVVDADHSSPLYKGSRTDTFFGVTGQYSMQTYYWRIDQADAGGNITKGNLWYYQPRQKAFRDAEGYGRFARGGRGGKVVYVTNLNDSGPGSLREAITNNTGPRTIAFAVSGIITLQSRLVVSQNNITIAGQTAPGKGICIRNAPIGGGGNDIVIRHIRVRVGGPVTFDGMGLVGDHSIIDNCSISWTMDEAFSSRGAKNITLQRTLISEALNVAGHQNYPPGTAHGYAATIGGYTGSFHHNLLAHCQGRNWSMGGGLDGNGFYSGKLDIRNNVVYNWRSRTTDGGAHQVNFVNNYYKPGAATTHFYALTASHEGVGKGTQQYYFSGNVMPGYFNEANQQAGRRMTITNGAILNWETFVDAPFFDHYIETQTAGDAYKRVLSNTGATQPEFDSHDQRIITETLNGTYTYSGSISGYPGLPDSQTDVGGWENYPEEQRHVSWDTDMDGLPDWWENLHRLNPNSATNDFSDANADADKDGYTQLDNYLEWMGAPHYFGTPLRLMQIDLTALSKGYTNNPTFTLSHISNGLAFIVNIGGNKKVIFLPLFRGLASFRFTVKDAEGSTMTRTVNILTNGSVAASLSEPLLFSTVRSKSNQTKLTSKGYCLPTR